MPNNPLSVPSNNEIEAQTLLERAEKKAKSFNFFGLAGSKQANCEEAAELCANAGNLLKIEKKWKEAGDAYVKSADYYIQAEDKDEAANKLVEASKSYKKSSPEDAVKVMIQATDLLKEKGRFHPAANNLKQVAEIYESDLGDLSTSMKYYEEAAELFSGEDSSGLANQCWVKVANFAAVLEDYEKAIEKFEYVASSSLDNNLTKYSAKQYFLQGGLCHMCRDAVTARKALEKYKDMDSSFVQSRECQLLSDLLDTFEANDSAKFAGYVAEYDRMSKLDAWKTKILLRIKNMISEESLT